MFLGGQKTFLRRIACYEHRRRDNFHNPGGKCPILLPPDACDKHTRWHNHFDLSFELVELTQYDSKGQIIR